MRPAGTFGVWQICLVFHVFYENALLRQTLGKTGKVGFSCVFAKKAG